MIFEDFKKKYKSLGLQDNDLKELYYLVSLSILSRIYPNENDYFLIPSEESEKYYDYLVEGYKIASQFFKFKFDKKFYDAFDFVIVNSQNFHYTVLFNQLENDLKTKLMDLLFVNRKNFKLPNLVRFFVTDLVYSHKPEKFLKIESYKNFVSSNAKNLFD